MSNWIPGEGTTTLRPSQYIGGEEKNEGQSLVLPGESLCSSLFNAASGRRLPVISSRWPVSFDLDTGDLVIEITG